MSYIYIYIYIYIYGVSSLRVNRLFFLNETDRVYCVARAEHLRRSRFRLNLVFNGYQK